MWDWDLIGNDFMGQAVIQLSDLAKGVQSEQWYKLEPRAGKKDEVSGDILVRVVLVQESTALPLGGAMSAALSKRVVAESAPPSLLAMALPSSPSPPPATMSEDEYSAMDDLRSGEIDLIIPALFKYSASTMALQVGLPAFAKWATTASVAERISILEKHKGSVFELLLDSASQNKTDGVIVFYSLHALGPFMRLFEAKQYWTPAMATLLAESLRSPPASLSAEDRTRHCTNCLISLSNACTFNKSNKDSKIPPEAVQSSAERCEQVLLTTGALDVALSLLANATPADPLTKHILALLIKLSHHQNCKSALSQQGFVKSAVNILSNWDDPVTLWLAIDALGKYATPASSSDDSSKAQQDTNKFAAEVLAVDKIWETLVKVSSRGIAGIHGASIDAGIVYLVFAISSSLKDSVPFSPKNLNDSHILKLITHLAASNYLANIPKAEQRPILPERCLKLISIVGGIDNDSRKLLGTTFAQSSKWIVEFGRFSSVLDEAAKCIKFLLQWGVLSKEDAVLFLQTAMKTAELDATTTKALEALIAQI